MKAMKVARRTFTFTDMDGSHGEVVAGERIVADHALVRDFPDEFRDFGLDDELAVRSAWVAEMNRAEAQKRHTSREPLSRAGRAEREELRFWDSVTRDLERTAPDRPTSAEQSEQAFFDQALASIEDSEAAELAEVNEAATRDFGFDRGWSRRVSD
jgi:hypothetical protein